MIDHLSRRARARRLDDPRSAFATALLFVVFALFAALSGTAARGAELAELRVDDVKRGELLFKTEREGIFHAAPQLRTDVRMDVSGLVNRVVVRQRFKNPDESWVEGVYVFPLPDGAAVDHLRMQVGDRFIEGEIREREQARREYEAARQAGQTASLLEQERPNIFTTSVANIGPGEEVVIEIEYQESLVYDAGTFALRFPMVVGPRYIPGTAPVASIGGNGWAPPTNRVPDADRITPPVLHPALGKINPVSLEIRIDAGFPLAAIESPSHAIASRGLDGDVMAVTLDEADVPADRDFVLEWTPRVGSAPSAGLFTQPAGDGGHYALLMVMPPDTAAVTEALPPREVIFVIDTSGSMEGTSIVQAKAALALALERLKPADRFNVIQFNSYTSGLFPEAVGATPRSIAQAQRYVAGLNAEGGTEMLPALEAALDRAPNPDGRLRQVIFLTDGSIGNESELFRAIHQRLGDRRLFTIGIGSAPNSFFMKKAAEYGRGTYTFIDEVGEVQDEMAKLFVKLERPVVTDLALAWPDGTKVEAMPAIVPDLYQGEPVFVAARLDRLDGALTLSGRRGGAPWRIELPLSGGRDHPGIGGLWARRKIEALDDSLYTGAEPDAVRKAIVEIALAHHLVSTHTSLVAIDLTPRRPDGETVDTRPLPTNLPAGWTFESVFGSLEERRASDPAPMMRQASLAASATPSQGATIAVPMPQGATAAELKLLAGTALLLLALVVLWRRRRWA